MDISDMLNQLILRKNLSYKNASDLMNAFLEGSLSEIQMAAFLVALRMKGEMPEEIAAFASVMRSKAMSFDVKQIDAIDTCGTGGDGLHTFNISTIAAIITASTGISIAKHGNRSISSKCGCADVLEELGVLIDAPKEIVEKCIKDANICFLFAPLCHSAMKNVMPIRKGLAIRTVFNMLGPLTNPLNAKKQVLGVYKPELCRLYGEVLMKMKHKEAYIVHGHDGLDEISTTAPTHVVHLQNERLHEFDITPEKFGIKRVNLDDIKGNDVKTNANIIMSILDGEKSPKRDIACLNAAFSIKLGGKATSLEHGYIIANEMLDSKKAKETLQKWISISKGE